MAQNEIRYRPLIASLSLNDQNTYLPVYYIQRIQQIQGIKKYLPKNLFKLNGVDVQTKQNTLSKDQEQKLHKTKIKLRSINGLSIQNKQPIKFMPKKKLCMVEWYSKSVDLQIPYNSRLSQQAIQQHVNNHLEYYFENFVLFKNTLTNEIYQNCSKKLSVQQLSTQTDIIFMNWNISPQPSDDSIKTIKTNAPIILSLCYDELYELTKIKQIIKSDIIASTSIMLKHGFNTRVIINGKDSKQFIYLNSYCNQQNAIKQQEKLKDILGQQKDKQVQSPQNQAAASKDNRFLVLVLGLLVLLYFGLKLYPINGRDQNQYMDRNSQMGQSYTNPSSDEQIF